MARRLLYRDLARGVSVFLHVDVMGGTVGIEEEYDENPILEHVRAMKDLPLSKEITPFMEVPYSLKARAIREGWDNDRDQWRRVMNDADYKYLRVWEGRV